MNKLACAFVIIYVMTSLLPTSACEYHRRLEEARRKAEAARLKRLQAETLSETRANLRAEGYVRAGPRTAINHPNTALKRPTHVNFQLTSLGNKQDSYNRNYRIGASRGMKCPGTNFYCPTGRQCVFKNGSYRCELPATTCSKGLRRVNITATQFRCEDINECEEENLNECEHVCKNLYGSYRCECPPGFQLATDGGCVDINECSQAYPVCQHECVNSEGSFQCVCPDGYELQDGTRCVDVNECEASDACEVGTKCMNLFGGYECEESEPCEEGYLRQDAQDDPFGPCIIEDYNEAHGYAKPFSVVRSRFAIHSGYRPGTEVARLRFHRSRGHHYRYELENGASHFAIKRVTEQGQNVVVVRTVRSLSGPALHEVTVVVYDTNLMGNYADNSYMSKVELSFVVSAYSF